MHKTQLVLSTDPVEVIHESNDENTWQCSDTNDSMHIGSFAPHSTNCSGWMGPPLQTIHQLHYQLGRAPQILGYLPQEQWWPFVISHHIMCMYTYIIIYIFIHVCVCPLQIDDHPPNGLISSKFWPMAHSFRHFGASQQLKSLRSLA